MRKYTVEECAAALEALTRACADVGRLTGVPVKQLVEAVLNELEFDDYLAFLVSAKIANDDALDD